MAAVATLSAAWSVGGACWRPFWLHDGLAVTLEKQGICVNACIIPDCSGQPSGQPWLWDSPCWLARSAEQGIGGGSILTAAAWSTVAYISIPWPGTVVMWAAERRMSVVSLPAHPQALASCFAAALYRAAPFTGQMLYILRLIMNGAAKPCCLITVHVCAAQVLPPRCRQHLSRGLIPLPLSTAVGAKPDCLLADRKPTPALSSPPPTRLQQAWPLPAVRRPRGMCIPLLKIDARAASPPQSSCLRPAPYRQFLHANALHAGSSPPAALAGALGQQRAALSYCCRCRHRRHGGGSAQRLRWRMSSSRASSGASPSSAWSLSTWVLRRRRRQRRRQMPPGSRA